MKEEPVNYRIINGVYQKINLIAGAGAFIGKVDAL